jgi:hypothetical protein
VKVPSPSVYKHGLLLNEVRPWGKASLSRVRVHARSLSTVYSVCASLGWMHGCTFSHMRTTTTPTTTSRCHHLEGTHRVDTSFACRERSLSESRFACEVWSVGLHCVYAVVCLALGVLAKVDLVLYVGLAASSYRYLDIYLHHAVRFVCSIRHSPMAGACDWGHGIDIGHS